MKISKNGLELIEKFEGFCGTAYKDCVGVLTIGYGSTNADKSILGFAITSKSTCTKTQAEKWLEKAVNLKYAPLVEKYDSIYHWNQNEFDAMVSFAYNIGSIDQLTARGTRTKKEISDKMLAYNKAGGKFVQGLYNRRKQERALFIKPCATKPVCPYAEPTKTVTSVNQAKLRGCKTYVSNGVSVKWVQWYLDKLGYNLGSYGIDGNCGSMTVNAILDFQVYVKIKDDGLCGAETRKKLIEVFNRKFK